MKNGDRKIIPDVSPRGCEEHRRSLREIRPVSFRGTKTEHFTYITENRRYLTSKEQKNEYAELDKAINKPLEEQSPNLADQFVHSALKRFGLVNTDIDIHKIINDVGDRKTNVEVELKSIDDSFVKRMKWLSENKDLLPVDIKNEHDTTVLTLEKDMDTMRSRIDHAKDFDEMQEHIQKYAAEADKMKQLQMKGLEALDPLWHAEIENKIQWISDMHSELNKSLEYLYKHRGLNYAGEYVPGVSFKEAIEMQYRNYNELHKNINAKGDLLLCETTSVKEHNIDKKKELLKPVNQVTKELTSLATEVAKLTKAVNTTPLLFLSEE